jgi:hypothetical protein
MKWLLKTQMWYSERLSKGERKKGKTSQRVHRGISEEAMGNQTHEESLIWQTMNGKKQLACLGL